MKVSIQGNRVVAVSETQAEAQTLLAFMFDGTERKVTHRRKSYTQVPRDRAEEYARKAAAMYNEGIKVPRIAEALGITASNTYAYIKKGGAVIGHPMPALVK